jgi:hypothetical protein
VAVAVVAGVDDLAGGDLEGGEQADLRRRFAGEQPGSALDVGLLPPV